MQRVRYDGIWYKGIGYRDMEGKSLIFIYYTFITQLPIYLTAWRTSRLW